MENDQYMARSAIENAGISTQAVVRHPRILAQGV